MEDQFSAFMPYFVFGIKYFIDLGKEKDSLKIKVIYLPYILVEQRFITNRKIKTIHEVFAIEE